MKCFLTNFELKQNHQAKCNIPTLITKKILIKVKYFGLIENILFSGNRNIMT
jgi:hypothetical protein